MTVNTSVELLSADEVKSLFEGVGAPADKLDDFVEVFNAAVTAQSNARVETLLAEKVAELEAKAEEHKTFLNEKAEEYKTLVKEEMNAKVDAYVKHFAEEFVADNKPVVESNVKSALFASLMSGLINLFEEHNIKLSDEGKDVLAETEAELATKAKQLAESQAQVIELTRQINEGKKAEIIATATADLTESQVEKVRELATDIVYCEAYADKIQRIVEAISGSTVTKPTETNNDVVTESVNQEPEKEISPEMQAYIAAARGKNSSIFH